MALSGLDIYKLLPKTNCKQCGFATCLAFAMQLAKKAVSIDKCPFLSEEVKRTLEASSLPPIQLVTIGSGENKVEIGNETVLFRHEEKFHHPCAIGCIIEDSLSDSEILSALKQIHALEFERVGQHLSVNMIAVRQKGTPERYNKVVELVAGHSKLALVLMSSDEKALEKCLPALKARRPLLYSLTKNNKGRILGLAKANNVPVVVSAPDLEALSALTAELKNEGITEMVLDTGTKPLSERVWDLTQERRLPLKKSARSLGYPSCVIVEDNTIDNADSYEGIIEAGGYILKYAGIVLVNFREPWQVLPLLTLRQNIYTDPQKPLQIEPKLYSIGVTSVHSPVLITTNFSLSYYTVLAEVEASKIPSYILSVDTEGMSVLTAWAAEKFTAEKISQSLEKANVKDAVTHSQIIIPGYVAVMSGDLEETSGWKVIVGPKEAAGIPAFLKNLQLTTAASK